MPAPSPVLASDPAAPRCSRLTRTVRASRTMACEGRPAMSTTNPNPHASCSVDGSYRVRVWATAALHLRTPARVGAERYAIGPRRAGTPVVIVGLRFGVAEAWSQAPRRRSRPVPPPAHSRRAPSGPTLPPAPNRRAPLRPRPSGPTLPPAPNRRAPLRPRPLRPDASSGPEPPRPLRPRPSRCTPCVRYRSRAALRPPHARPLCAIRPLAAPWRRMHIAWPLAETTPARAHPVCTWCLRAAGWCCLRAAGGGLRAAGWCVRAKAWCSRAWRGWRGP